MASQDFFQTPSLDLSDPLATALLQRSELHSLDENIKVAQFAHEAAVAKSLAVSAHSGPVQERVQQSAAFFFSQGSDSYSANMRAIAAVGGAVRREAFLLAYSDCFLALGCVLLASAIALFFMKRAHISCAVSGH
jgi:hypothetical protein